MRSAPAPSASLASSSQQLQIDSWQRISSLHAVFMLLHSDQFRDPLKTHCHNARYLQDSILHIPPLGHSWIPTVEDIEKLNARI